MAAGHSNKPTRQDLLNGLLRKADTEPRHARPVRLLAAACLETVGSLDVDVRSTIEACLARLVPPRREEEASSLASAGPALLRRAQKSLSAMSVQSAKAMIRSVALQGSLQALEILSYYATDSRPDVLAYLASM
jgi:hypothetical protein